MDKNMSALLDTNACTIRVRFQHDEDSSAGYTYVHSSKDIKIGDLVMVTTNNRQPKVWAKEFMPKIFPDRLSIAIVIAVDEDVQIEPNAEIRYHWTIGKINLDEHLKLRARNEEIEAVLGEAYKQNLRRSFASQALGGLPDEVKKRVTMSLGHNPID